MTRSVQATNAARRQLAQAAEWWRAHRDKNPDLFDDELEERLEALRELDIVYVTLRLSNGRAVNRILMPQTRHWLYFTMEAESVTLLACWHTSRATHPPIEDD